MDKEKLKETMEIKRKRYVVMRNNRTEIWGGLARCFNFIKINELKDTAIKTYRSEAQAESGCSSLDRNFEVVECEEILRIKDETDGLCEMFTEKWGK